jgi:hypothetical protein
MERAANCFDTLMPADRIRTTDVSGPTGRNPRHLMEFHFTCHVVFSFRPERNSMQWETDEKNAIENIELEIA